MARMIVWAPTAKERLQEILTYYKLRNGNAHYSHKLYKLLKDMLKLVSNNPMVGKETEYKSIRFVIPHPDYSIFYRYDETQIEVLVLWDNRQDPGKLQIR